MQNVIITTVPTLVATANKVIAGMSEHAADLPLPYAVAADLPAKLTALNTSAAAHQTAVTALKAQRLEVETAAQNARTYMTLVRDSLKPRLGGRYSQRWNALGITGTLTVPRKAESLLSMLQLTKVYLTANPVADGGANVGAARAQVLHDAIVAEITALAQSKEAVAAALGDRNAREKALEKGIRTVLSELHQVLDPMDSRWLSFGFVRPGQKVTPDAPTKVLAVLVGLKAAAVKWEKSPRAEYYRVWMRIVGVEDEFTPVGSPADLDFTIEDLPANSEIEIRVTAVNNGGESAFSEPRTINTTPVAT